MISKNSIEERNRSFYDDVYKSNNWISHYLHQLLSYDQQSKSRVNYKVLKKHLRKLSNLRILDYGSGHGCLLLKFDRSNVLFGCDISQEAIGNLKRSGMYLGKNLKAFVPERAEELIENETLDIITSSHVLEHVPDDTSVIKLIHRKLKRGGIFLLNLPVNEVWDDPNHLRNYTEDAILDMIKQHNFEIINTKKSGRINGWMIETANRKSSRMKFTLRILKLCLILSPYFVFSWIEKYFFKSRVHTHFIVLALKS